MARAVPSASRIPKRPRSRRAPKGARRWRLRTAAPADLETLVRHRRRMWKDIGGRTTRELDRADGPYRAWVRRQTRARRFVAFLVEAPDGRVAGSGAIWLQPAQPRPGTLSRETMPYILSMFTEPEFRGRGIATRLVRAMLRWATERGYRRIFLHASTMGRPIYARLGFTAGNEMRLDLPVRRGRPSPRPAAGPGRPGRSARARPGARGGAR